MILNNAPRFFLAIIVLITLPITQAIAENTQNISNQQLKPFEWNHDACYCKAQLDTSKISPATLTLLLDELYPFRVKGEIAWTELHKLNQEQLEMERDRYLKEYDVSLNNYSSLKLPTSPVLNKYKNDLMLEAKLKKFLYIAELNYLITDSNKHLDGQLEDLGYASACGKYSQDLGSEQRIRNSSPAFIDNHCAKNVNPAECTMRLTQKASSLKDAKIMILMFGWHNCVNNYYRSKISPNQAEAYEAIKTYLQNIQCECEEAD